MSGLDVNRREFLKIAAGAGAALAMPTLGHTAVSSKMIGIQVGAVSFVDEGTEKVLDVLQERCCICGTRMLSSKGTADLPAILPN